MFPFRGQVATSLAWRYYRESWAPGQLTGFPVPPAGPPSIGQELRFLQQQFR